MSPGLRTLNQEARSASSRSCRPWLEMALLKFCSLRLPLSASPSLQTPPGQPVGRDFNFRFRKNNKKRENKKRVDHSSHSITQACTPTPSSQPRNKTIFLQTGDLKRGVVEGSNSKTPGDKLASRRGPGRRSAQARAPAGAGLRGAGRPRGAAGLDGPGGPQLRPQEPRAPLPPRAPVSWLSRRVPCYLLGRREPTPWGRASGRTGGAAGPSPRPLMSLGPEQDRFFPVRRVGAGEGGAEERVSPRPASFAAGRRGRT